MCTTMSFRLVFFSGLLYEYLCSSESDTSNDDTSYEVEMSEDEDYDRVMGIDVDMATTRTTMVSTTLSTLKRPYPTPSHTGERLYRLNATERKRTNEHNKGWLTASNTPTKVEKPPDDEKPEPRGPFYDFIKNICNVTISRFSGRKIIIFLTVLDKTLKGMGYGRIMKRWVHKFRKRIRLYTLYKGKFIRPIIQMFCNYTTERRHYKDLFFNTINSIFSLTDDNRFDDYIYDLKRFAASRVRHIKKETMYVFQKMIYKKMLRQKESVLDNILLKFVLLLKEFHDLQKKGVVEF